jgi:hypothetical protein
MAILLNPVSRLQYTQSKFIIEASKNKRLITATLDLLGVRELFDGNEQLSKSDLCMLVPVICDLTNCLISTSDPILDDEEAY